RLYDHWHDVHPACYLRRVSHVGGPAVRGCHVVDSEEHGEGGVEGLIATVGAAPRFRRRSCSLISSPAKRSSFSPLVRSDSFLPRNSAESTPLSVSAASPASVVTGAATCPCETHRSERQS
ncbi:hypothetical protein BHM03_00028330, partial [Ensete ventricosum]